MDILKTFEIFLSLPLSIFRRKNIQIMHLETANKKISKSMDVKINDDSSTTINVVNNYKMYSLLSTVMYKKKLNAENNTRKVHN